MKHTIYALVDPNTGLIRYVGRTYDPHVRLLGHLAAASKGSKPVHKWLRDIAPDRPYLIVLQELENTRTADNTISNVSVAEAKWLKRFRRTALNYIDRRCGADQDFVNSPALEG